MANATMSTEESDVDVVYRVYDTILLVLSGNNMMLQVYIIFVILRIARNTLNEYRYFLLLSEVLELCFSVCLGFVVRPRALPPTSCASIQGIFAFAGHETAGILMCLLPFLGCALVLSQYSNIAYRLTAVLSGVGVEIRFMRPGVLVPVFGACFGVAGGIAYAVSWTQLAVNDLTERLPEYLAQGIIRPADISIRCFGLETPRTYFIGASIGAFFVASQVAFVGAGLLTIRKLKQQKAISKSTRAMQLQLTRLLTVQILSPVICVLVPVTFIYVANIIWSVLGVSRSSVLSVALKYAALLCISLFPLLNSVLTLTFIAPYRRFTAAWMRGIMRGEMRKIFDSLDASSLSGSHEARRTSTVRYSLPKITPHVTNGRVRQ